MFLRKLTVVLVPLSLMILICVLVPLIVSLCTEYWSGLLLGFLLGTALSLLLPLSGATKLREPFAFLLWIPAALIVLVLLYQYLASVGVGADLPVLRLLKVNDARIIFTESAFCAYMVTFSIRTGKRI